MFTLVLWQIKIIIIHQFDFDWNRIYHILIEHVPLIVWAGKLICYVIYGLTELSQQTSNPKPFPPIPFRAPRTAPSKCARNTTIEIILFNNFNQIWFGSRCPWCQNPIYSDMPNSAHKTVTICIRLPNRPNTYAGLLITIPNSLWPHSRYLHLPICGCPINIGQTCAMRTMSTLPNVMRGCHLLLLFYGPCQVSEQNYYRRTSSCGETSGGWENGEQRGNYVEHLK